MADAMVLIGKITLTVAQSNIKLENIPTRFKDLRLVVSGTMSASASPSIRFNDDAGSNYSYVGMYGFSSGANSATASGATQGPCGWIPTSPLGQFLLTVDILNAFATDRHKCFIARGSDSAQYVDTVTSRWANTTAINSITLTGYNGGGTYAAGTTLELFGIIG